LGTYDLFLKANENSIVKILLVEKGKTEEQVQVFC
jgi:hypothetical protein